MIADCCMLDYSFFLLWDNCSAWKTKWFFFFFLGCLMLVFSLKATINYYNLFCLGCQEEFCSVSYYNLGICDLVCLNWTTCVAHWWVWCIEGVRTWGFLPLMLTLLGFCAVNDFTWYGYFSHALVWLKRIQMGHLKENCCNGKSFIKNK